MSAKILLADDDAALRRVIQFKLKQKGYDVTAVENGEQALNRIPGGHFDLLLTDMKMPGMSGIDLLAAAKIVSPELQVILITAFAEISQAVEAVKLGAFDYITKPFDDDQLLVAVEKALKFKNLENENKLLREQLKGHDFIKNIVGVSKPFKELLGLVDKIAPTDATVLISGESGTGKEIIARAIHYKSHRHDKEFIAVNCAAIPRDLIESELFGHTKGAFTGAVKDKKGKFELADSGTILLDEISELNIELQAKLLRVIQERTLEPVGSEKKLEIDVRIIAASNTDLRDAVGKGRFREDLFYRLNVIPVHVPALRERPEDIPILTTEFLKRFAPGAEIDLSDDLMKALFSYNWPGNIRELENLMERMAILRKSDRLTAADLPQDFGFSGKLPIGANVSNSDLTYREAEKKLILDALEKYAWNKSRAAKHLEIPRHVLIYRMKKYALFHQQPQD
ncbi:MAG: DNA-binding response regulator [candidate division Zixibacteria bacterium HGW-Zixibacteria-1]|nr:MAG: DNA-binding response regulator [candidate division Zixibacteria bacterium HGW-Zixibacteria-1]